MMRMRKTITALLAAALTVCLCGCQLARPEAADAGGIQGDRLIGVYVTFDYLDTFDMDGWLSDNLDRLGGDVTVSQADVERYSSAIPAERTPDGDWVFPGLDGMGYYCPVQEDEDGTYIGSHLDEGLCSGGMHLTSTDQGDQIELDCTVYVTASDKTCLYCNPVYQRPDGQVYLTGGNGGMSSEGDHAEGQLFVMTLNSSDSSVIDGGTEESYGCSVTVRLWVMYAPEEIVLIQMDGGSREISRSSYAPGLLPERLTLEKDCAFVLAETRKTGPDGGPAVTRELIELREDGSTLFGSFYARADGVCVRQETELVGG